jgi:hypothetical protein
MVKTKSKGKKKLLKPLTFRQLLGRVLKHEGAASLVKTAVQTGWLYDEDFLTKLTDQEQNQVKEVYNKDSAFKRAKAVDLAPALPESVGYLADDFAIVGEQAKLTNGEKEAFVDARLFLTMKKRHPEACVYFSLGDVSIVIFSERSTVAVLPTA